MPTPFTSGVNDLSQANVWLKLYETPVAPVFKQGLVTIHVDGDDTPGDTTVFSLAVGIVASGVDPALVNVIERNQSLVTPGNLTRHIVIKQGESVWIKSDKVTISARVTGLLFNTALDGVDIGSATAVTTSPTTILTVPPANLVNFGVYHVNVANTGTGTNTFTLSVGGVNIYNDVTLLSNQTWNVGCIMASPTQPFVITPGSAGSLTARVHGVTEAPGA